MRKNLLLLLTLVSIFLLGGCQSNTEKTEEDSNEQSEVNVTEETNIKTDDSEEVTGGDNALGVIKVGMDGETPGYTSVDENGDLVGIDVAIWEEIAKRNDLEVEFMPAAFSSLFGMLDSDKIDVVANCIGVTDERSERYYFSEPYVYDENVLLASADKSINDIKDLNGWKIAVEPASMDEKILDRFEEANDIKLDRVFYDGLAIQDVILGRVDLWIKAESGAIDVVNEYGEDQLQIIAGTGDGDFIAYPFKKNERGEKLKKIADETIKQMQEDGTMSELANEYLPTDPTKIPEE